MFPEPQNAHEFFSSEMKEEEWKEERIELWNTISLLKKLLHEYRSKEIDMMNELTRLQCQVQELQGSSNRNAKGDVQDNDVIAKLNSLLDNSNEMDLEGNDWDYSKGTCAVEDDQKDWMDDGVKNEFLWDRGVEIGMGDGVHENGNRNDWNDLKYERKPERDVQKDLIRKDHLVSEDDWEKELQGFLDGSARDDGEWNDFASPTSIINEDTLHSRRSEVRKVGQGNSQPSKQVLPREDLVIEQFFKKFSKPLEKKSFSSSGKEPGYLHSSSKSSGKEPRYLHSSSKSSGSFNKSTSFLRVPKDPDALNDSALSRLSTTSQEIIDDIHELSQKPYSAREQFEILIHECDVECKDGDITEDVFKRNNKIENLKQKIMNFHLPDNFFG